MRAREPPVGQALAGEHAFVKAGDALVLAEQIADLAAAHANVARGHVHILSDVAVQFSHEALAEAHDLLVGLALGSKSAPPFAPPDGQPGERVLKYLLKAQEFENAQIHRGMEAQPAFVGPDGVVELDAIALVDADMALVVHPGNAEENDAVRLDHALEDGVAAVNGGPCQPRAPGSPALRWRPDEIPARPDFFL